VIDLKVKLMEMFENLIHAATKYNVGYFSGRHSEKGRCYLEVMYSSSLLSEKGDSTMV